MRAFMAASSERSVPSRALSVDALNTESRLVRYAIECRSVPIEPPDPLPNLEQTQSGKSGKAHEGERGKLGRPQPEHPCNHCGTRATPANQQLTREDMKALARSAAHGRSNPPRQPARDCKRGAPDQPRG